MRIVLAVIFIIGIFYLRMVYDETIENTLSPKPKEKKYTLHYDKEQIEKDALTEEATPALIQEFQNLLPRCINSCSQYQLWSAYYFGENNEVHVTIKTNYPNDFLTTYDKSSLIMQEKVFWNNYINLGYDTEARKLNYISSKYNLRLTMVSSEGTMIGTITVN